MGKLTELVQVIRLITRHPLNKDHKLRALARFAAWQVGSRLVQAPVVVPWVNGTRFMVRRGDTGITGNLYCGLHEYIEMAFVLHATSPDDLFVDIGANVGSYVLLACGAAGARGVALEPIPSTYAKLIENLRLNDLMGRVRAVNAGAADVHATLRFTSDLDTVNHVASNADGNVPTNVIEVPVHPIDELLDGACASILKIDVEGYEYQVIQGARNTLGKAKAIIIELNGSGSRYGHSDDQIVASLRELGFSPYRYLPETRTLEMIDRPDTARSPNAIFVRDIDGIKQALARNTRYLLNGTEV
jgi:FkbM family methyltransferase